MTNDSIIKLCKIIISIKNTLEQTFKNCQPNQNLHLIYTKKILQNITWIVCLAYLRVRDATAISLDPVYLS